MKIYSYFVLMLITIGFTPNNLFSQDYNYHSPLDIPLILSGNFGELRRNHFHTGLDIKTQGTIGKNVYSIDEGIVKRIRVSNLGYGNALYIEHPNGITSVYAHLRSFNKSIDSLAKIHQLKYNFYEIDVVLDETIKIEKGEIIALSGNTGSSAGPHLHFELRNTSTEQALNPLNYGFVIADAKEPKMFGLEIYEINEGYTIDNKYYNVIKTKSGKNIVQYKGDTIKLLNWHHSNSKIGFALQGNDYFDGANNRCGFYKVELYVDGVKEETVHFDSISFDHNRHLNVHTNYNSFTSRKRHIHKIFQEEHNFQNIHLKKFKGSSFKNDTSKIKIVVTDYSLNSAELKFVLVTKCKNKGYKIPASYLKPNEMNVLEKDKFKIIIAPGTLNKLTPNNLTSIKPGLIKFGSFHNPVNKHYIIKVKAIKDSNTVLICDRNGSLQYFSPKDYFDGEYTFKVRTFGNFYLGSDSLAPKVSKANFKDGQSVTNFRFLSFYISDSQTGIAKYQAWVNGEKEILSYKRSSGRYSIKTTQLVKGANTLKIIAIDGRGNINTQIFTVNSSK
jgi:hypothetical protein